MGKVFFYIRYTFNYENIIDYESRPFQDIEEMNKTIIENWNNTVSKNDTVFVLGDVGFFKKDKAIKIINGLNGHKYLIMGNHDKAHSTRWWREVGFKEVSKYPIIYNKNYILSHEPIFNESTPYINIHGHIHSKRIDSLQHFNVSVECINYTPIPFTKIVNLLTKNNLLLN